jgi:hypothetical protein
MTECKRAGRTFGLVVSAMLLVSAAGFGGWAAGAAAGPASRSASRSGIDTEYESPSTRPQDDLYRYLNGKWLDEFQIPADKGIYVSFTEVADRTEDQLHTIVDDLAQSSEAMGETPGGGDARKLADLFASFMDEPSRSSIRSPPSMLCRRRSRFLR